MNINNLFKYGSTVNITLKTYSDRTIAGTSYLAGQPYTIVENVNCSFSYMSKNNAVRVSGNLLDMNEEYPDAIILQNVPLTEKITNLIFERKNSGELSNVSYSNSGFLTTDENAKLFLPQLDVKDLYIYQNNTLILNIPTLVGNTVISDLLTPDTEYLVFYDTMVESTATVYSFSTPHNAYFTLEVEGTGNINDETASVYLKFLKCSLLTQKSLDFTGTSNTVNLHFAIILDKESVKGSYIVFG